MGEKRVTRIDKVVLASNNEHKLIEIRNILKNLSIDVISLKDAGIDIDVEEDGLTFEENSFKKANEVKKLTKHAVLADDSGLQVYALGLSPGVYSARYAGENATDEENNTKLLNEMENVQDSKRGARFVTVLTLITPDNEKIVVRGEVRGVIEKSPRGENGFGYDPLFTPDGYTSTFGELSMDEKNSMSHRSRALENLRNKLKRL
ncbi:XTP/dITP diphosphatase [Clostridium cylindrosporum]|uniref:XTP/dITP diphosphatase n=1 Tax=Clostridium cylindrosporum TaxID=1495 RepID=UPI003BFA736E